MFVESRNPLPLEKHLEALEILKSRGPDFSRYQYQNNRFIAQSVLHITGSADYYNHVHKNFLAYNGEIYNYRSFGPYNNDIEFVHECVENNILQLKHSWGTWAWIWNSDEQVRYASDPQGEKALFQYQDDNIFIVSSEVAVILHYVDPEKNHLDYATRHWAMLNTTPYKGIEKIQPGVMYSNGVAVSIIDDVFSWIDQPKYKNFDQAYEDFCSTWKTVISAMTPQCPAALTYSGGLDTSIILNTINDLELYTTNMIGKDPISDCIKDFVNKYEHKKLHQLMIDESQWATAFLEILQRTKMPIQSWSFVGQWIISQNCKQRVLFTGVGADELFGGYDIYQKLNFNLQYSVSPYSEHGDADLWQRCMSAYDGHAGQATLLMDYWYQIAGCDARGIDVIAGAWGIESRNPFLAKPMMQLALNLPFEFKVGTVAKPLIRRLFLERWSPAHVMPKKGFSGHCNDSLPWLNIKINPSGNRQQDWKQIVLKSFDMLPNLPTHQTTRV